MGPLDYGVDIIYSPIHSTLAGMLSDGAAAVPTNGCMYTIEQRKKADVCKSTQDGQIYSISYWEHLSKVVSVAHLFRTNN